MSKFLEQVRRLHLDRERPYKLAIPGELTTIEQDMPTVGSQYATATVYRIKVEVGSQIAIQFSEDHDHGRDLSARRLRDAIAEEIYGDVRRGILGLVGDLATIKQADKNLKHWQAVERIEAKLDAMLASITP